MARPMCTTWLSWHHVCNVCILIVNRTRNYTTVIQLRLQLRQECQDRNGILPIELRVFHERANSSGVSPDFVADTSASICVWVTQTISSVRDNRLEPRVTGLEFDQARFLWTKSRMWRMTSLAMSVGASGPSCTRRRSTAGVVPSGRWASTFTLVT